MAISDVFSRLDEIEQGEKTQAQSVGLLAQSSAVPQPVAKQPQESTLSTSDIIGVAERIGAQEQADAERQKTVLDNTSAITKLADTAKAYASGSGDLLTQAGHAVEMLGRSKAIQGLALAPEAVAGMDEATFNNFSDVVTGIKPGQSILQPAADAIKQAGKTTSDYWDKSMSEGGQILNRTAWQDAPGAANKLHAAVLGAAQSAPQTIGIGYAGKALTGVLPLAQAVPGMARGLTRIGLPAPLAQKAAKWMTRGAVYGSAEGISAGLSNAAQVGEDIDKMDFAALAEKSPKFNEYLAQLDPSIPVSEREAIAKGMLKEDAENMALWATAGLSTVTGSLAGAGIFDKVLSSKRFLLNRALGGLKEAHQEFWQSGLGEKLPANLAMQQADQGVGAMDDVWHESVAGAGPGAIMGLVAGGGGRHAQNKEDDSKGALERNLAAAQLERMNLPTRDLIAIRNGEFHKVPYAAEMMQNMGLTPEHIDGVLENRYSEMSAARATLERDINQGPLVRAATMATTMADDAISRDKLRRDQQDRDTRAAIDQLAGTYNPSAPAPTEQTNRRIWPAVDQTTSTVHNIEDRTMQGEWDAQEQAARDNLAGRFLTKKEQPAPTKPDPLAKAKAAFDESYNAIGTVPESRGNVTDEEAAAFEKKVERERAEQRRRAQIKAFKARQDEADAAINDEAIPDDVKKAAAQQAHDIINADPVYKHLAEAKKRGKINLDAMREAYDSDTIGMINRRYPGIFSLVGTINPDEFASEMGYENLDAMVRRFSEARTKKELTGQIIREKTGEWQQAENDQQDYFGKMAEREQGREWTGAGQPVTKQTGTVFPAPDEAVSAVESMIKRKPKAFSESDFDHWTYTADQQSRLRTAHREALSALETSDNNEHAQQKGDDVAGNATGKAENARKSGFDKPSVSASLTEGNPARLDTPPDKSLGDGVGGYSHAGGNIGERGTAPSHINSPVNIPGKTSELVKQDVFPLGHDNEVTDRVVESVPVDVVNDFTGTKSSPENALHDKPVLESLPPDSVNGNTDKTVKTPVPGEISNVPSSGRPSTFTHGSPVEKEDKLQRKDTPGSSNPQQENGKISVSQSGKNETQTDLPITGETQTPSKTEDTKPLSVEEELAATSDDDLAAMLDDVFGEQAKPVAPKAPAKSRKPAGDRQPRKQQPTRTAGQITKEGGIAALEGVKSAMEGLNQLFGGKNLLGSGMAFDEETYAKAKPHFVAAWNDAKRVGYSLKELLTHVHNEFGKAIRPYLERFLSDVKAGNLTVDEKASTVNQADKQQQQPEGGQDDNVSGAGTEENGQSLREDDTATEGTGNRPLVRVAPEVRQGSDQEQPATDGGTGSGNKGKRGNQGADGAGVSKPRGGRGGNAKVHSAATGTGSDQGDGGSGALTDAPATIPAKNFIITDDVGLGKGGQAQKYRDNIAAIRILKQLVLEQRRATPDEQKALARYVGWGGIPNAFRNAVTGEVKEDWKDRVDELEGLLTKEELETARNSTQNAHYTAGDIVTSIWKAVRRLGFNGGLVLEPSVGTGNFLGLMPQEIAGSTKFIAAEFDGITAGIAQALYPQEGIFHTPFEKLPLPSGEFDLVIGNPPFGQSSLSFAHLPSINRHSIHNQFFLAGLDALKPGGVQAFVVSRYLMDAKDSSVRREIAEQAKLLAAIRLPQTAFKENALTDVVTDIIFLQKKEATVSAEENKDSADGNVQAGKPTTGQDNTPPVPSWVDTVEVIDKATGEPMTINSYFAQKPSMVMGTIDRSGSMRYEGDITVRYTGDNISRDIEAELNAALPENIMQHNDAVGESEKRFKTMADSLEIALSGAEDGSISIDKKTGKLVLVREMKMEQSGSYMLTRVELSPGVPWSNKLTLQDDGSWIEEVDQVDANGDKVKRIIGGKTSKLNAKELKRYTDKDVPDGYRLGQLEYNRLLDAVSLLDTLKAQINLEMNQQSTDAKIEANRKKLVNEYDKFVATHKYHLSSPVISKLIADMPDGALLLSLEASYTKAISADQAKKLGKEPRKAEAEPSAILSKRVIFPYTAPEKTSNPQDALAITLSEQGKVDMDMLADLLDKTADEVATELHDKLDDPLIYKNPETGQWETADEYLGGNVVQKLHAAKAEGLEKNVEALTKIQPEPWGADKVTVMPGATWVPETVYADFITHLTGAPAKVRFGRATNTFAVVRANDSTATAKQWSTKDRGVSRIAEAILNSKTIRVTYTDSDGRIHVDQDATELANIKLEEVKAEFSSWIFRDGERRRLLVDLFNKKYNVRVNRQRNGQHLKFPGKVPDHIISLRRHQKNGVWRGIVDRFVLYDHAVGAGKTFTGIARALERKRMGLSRKPMIIVPNHLVEQFAADVYKLYPGAKVLAAGKKDLEKSKRRRVFAKIATGDWDIVIVPHSSFAFIGIDPATETRYLEEELKVAEEAVKEAEAQAEEDGINEGWRKIKPLSVKQAEALRDKLLERLKKLKDRAPGKDRLLTFEQMGVDDLTVDEAHEFKNLFYSSNMQARGMNPRAGSAKAYDLWLKSRVLRESGGSIAFMTGTPISNSAVEMYGLMRYLAADEIVDMGIDHFDAWRAQFVDATTEYEPTESGRGLKEVNRLGRDWSNMRSLMDLYYSFADCVTNDDIKKWYLEDKGKEFPIPRVKGGGRVGVNVKPTPGQESELQRIVAEFEALPDEKDIKIRNAQRLRLMDQARKISLDVRALNPKAPGEPGGKLELAAKRIHDIYKQWNADKGTQLVFLDRSVPKSKGDQKRLEEYDALLADLRVAERTGDEVAERKAIEALDKFDANEMEELRTAQTSNWNGYQQIKNDLVAMGIPANEIRFVQEANTDEQKQAMFDEVNAGAIRVLIGSTPRMGAGTNVQERLVALHHVDVTWKPSDIEQREGRIIRQKNKLLKKYGIENFEVEILAYTTESTVDAKLWSLNSTKLRMINGIRQYNGEFNMEFDDEDSVGMAEIAAIASGDPMQLERVKLDGEIKKLERQQSAFRRQQWGAQEELDRAEQIASEYPDTIPTYEELASTITAATKTASEEAAKRTVTIDGKVFSYESLLYGADENPYRYVLNKRDQAKDDGEKFSVEIDGETTRSTDKAEEKITAALGDEPRRTGRFEKLPFDVTINGEHFFSRDGARRKIADLANQAMEGKPDDMGEVQIGTVLVYGIPLSLSVESHNTTDKRGEPVKEVLFYFEHEAAADNGGKPVRISSAKQGTVLRINNKVNINSLTDLFDIIGQVEFIPTDTSNMLGRLDEANAALPSLREKAATVFPKEQELNEKRIRLAEVERELASRKGGTPVTETAEPTRGVQLSKTATVVSAENRANIEQEITAAIGGVRTRRLINSGRVVIIDSQEAMQRVIDGAYPGESDHNDPARFSKLPDSRIPKKTVKAYKLFRTMKSRPGELFPLFIGKNEPTPVGEWIEAEFLPTKGFAPRPGWHAGVLPKAPHLMKKDGSMAEGRVWAEVEIPADVDWQQAADSTKTGDIRDRVPEGGSYRFKTSKLQGGAWIIGGAIKVNRILSSAEVDAINNSSAVKYSKDGAIQGAYVNGTTYLVRDGIEKGQAFPVLLHELGEHAGQLGFTNDAEYQSILKSLENRKDAKGATGDAIRAAMARVPASTKPEHYWSEVAAYLIENNANEKLTVFDRIKAFFKKLLVKAGLSSPDTLTHKDLVAFARAAVNAAAREGGLQSKRGDDMLFSQQVLQAISSAATSLNQVAAVFKRGLLKQGTTNVDIGGGKYDAGTEYLDSIGVENLVFDPFNRDKAHNDKVVRRLSGGLVDTATVNNVLNVIKEAEIRAAVIRQAAKAVKNDGTAYFQIHEGDGDGNSRVTKVVNGAPASWQNHQRAEWYINQIEQFFDSVTRKGNVIIATQPKKDDSMTVWSDGAGTPMFSKAMPQTATDAFKRWFGKSKVTKNGQPHILYHGTQHPQFLKDKEYPWVFDQNRPRNQASTDFAGLGIFLGDATIATAHAGWEGTVHPFYVRMENPYTTTSAELEKKLATSGPEAFRKRLQELNGHDGIIITDRGHAVVFEPNQVKSATDNTGAFSNKNPDVRYSRSSLADVVGPDRAAAIEAIADGGYSAAAEQAYFKAMAKEGDDTVNVDDVALRTKAADWFRSLIPVVKRKTLGALTLRQLRDVFAGRLPQMEMFYQATRDQDVDAKKIMTKADEVYNKWASLSKKAAKDMSELMIKATIGEVNPDMAQFEPRANSKALRQRIDANLSRIAEINEELKGAGNIEKLTDEKVRLERSITKATEKIENEVRRFKAHQELAPMYRTLSKEAKEVYQDVKKLYTDNLESLYAALEERISRQVTDPRLRKETLDAIRMKYDRYLENGPYFPLSRFGEYLSVATKGGRREVRTFDTMAERTRYMRRRRRDGWEVQAKTKRDFTRETAGASSGFVEGIFEILDGTKGIPGPQMENLKDQINQHFIKALPDLSHRKHFVHREKVEGYSRDQMRAFADNMQHAAHHIARIRHADKLETAVQSILQESKMMGKDQEGDEITDLYNELNARLKILNNPEISPVTQALTAGGFVMNIGPSIASALVNMSQTPLVAFPILATRFKKTGSISAMNALMKATADYMSSKPRLESGPSLIDNKKLPQHERDMIQALIDDGTIDVTAAHSLAQAAGNDFFNMARTKHGHMAMRAMRLVSYPFHVAELANRKVTALAAYRLALKNGMNNAEAINETREAVLESHFDYSGANRARWMEGNVRRVLLLFKQYSQQMTWLLGRSFYQAAKGESAEVKAMAKKRLAMILGGHFLLAGMQGMPVIGGIGAVLQFLFSAFGDDDDPVDLEVSLRNILADAVGAKAGESLMNGPWRSIPGLGDIDLSSRVSLGDLWFRAPEREAEGRDKWNQYVNLLLGPVATNASNIFIGAGTMADGQVWRGMEMMLPKFVKDAMKSVRYAREGVKNWQEDTLLDNLSAIELFGQSLGFTPANISEMYEGANAIKNHESRVNKRRQLLVNRWVQATRRGDSTEAMSTMADITSFNQKQPLFGINNDTLRRSYQGRIKAQEQTKGGTYLPATKEGLRDIGRFVNTR